MILSRLLFRPSTYLIMLIALAWACSSDDDSEGNGSGGSGTGAAGSGAQPATGGASGGRGGTAGTGATPATGGRGGGPATGGTPATGGGAGSGGMVGDAATGGAGGEPATDGGGGRAPETDGGAGSDGASPIAYTDYCGCRFASAEDHTGQTAVTVSFGGSLGDAYWPNCIKVDAGTAVTFSGGFSDHPFGVASTTDPGNPAMDTFTGTSATFTYSTAGTFGYYCYYHGTPTGQGMCGAVYVVP